MFLAVVLLNVVKDRDITGRRCYGQEYYRIDVVLPFSWHLVLFPFGVPFCAHGRESSMQWFHLIAGL